MDQRIESVINVINAKDQRYKSDAYSFVMEALSFTQKRNKCPRHISGEDLLAGIKELIIKKYGPMALTVLNHWGIFSTKDFGNIVFNLVEHSVLSKTEDDSIEVFHDAYDFEKTFDHGYRKELEKKISRMK